MLKQIVLATRNAGKVAELRHALSARDVELHSVADFPDAPVVVEDAETLAGNARKKALALHHHTGLPALADDTGLEVDALGGRPGVHAARYAGPAEDPLANRALLLRELAGQSNRAARFRTVMALATVEGLTYFEGVCEGQILDHERGEGGFGYDAVFRPAGLDRTFAELTKDEKNALSHRGHAVRALVQYLESKQTGAGL